MKHETTNPNLPLTTHKLAHQLRERQIHHAIDMAPAKEIGIAKFRQIVSSLSDEEIIMSYLTDSRTQALLHVDCDYAYIQEQCDRGRIYSFSDFDEILSHGCFWFANRLANLVLFEK